LEFEGNQQANYHGEQTQTFDQSRYNQHGGLDFAGSFRLTANSLHGATTNAANAQTNAQRNQTSTNAGTHYGQTSSIHNLQQQREKHKKKEKWEKRKKRNEVAGKSNRRPG
jgi:hypothetical protein